MKKLQKIYIIPVAILLLAIAGLIYTNLQYQYSPSGYIIQSTSSTSDNSIKDGVIGSDDHYFTELFRTGSRIFWCKERAYTESSCLIFVSDINGNEAQGLSVGADLPQNVIVSPDKKNAVILLDQQAILLNTDTLVQKVIFQSSENEVLGTYSGFPYFYGEAKWIDNSKISISIYDKDHAFNESVPLPKPLREKIINI